MIDFRSPIAHMYHLALMADAWFSAPALGKYACGNSKDLPHGFYLSAMSTVDACC